MKKLMALLAGAVALTACASKSVPVEPVAGFEKDRYLGTWYEIARLDHSFERGLTNVTARYSLRDDGKIRVLNKGFDPDKGSFDEAEGKAKFKDSETVAHLKVSFFGPFYGDYIVFDLDKDGYEYAFISGGTEKYLWLLARRPEVSEDVRQSFVTQAKALGYNTDALIWVDQSKAD